MSDHVKVLTLAREDVRETLEWLSARSPKGAKAWLDALEACTERIAVSPTGFSTAPESQELPFKVQQAFFQTKNGRRYRVLFLVQESQVLVVRIRGPGQRPVRAKDLRLDE